MRMRGQATLEFTLVFIIATALLLGLLGLWKWSSDNIISRQIEYNKTAERVNRGTRPSPSLATPRPQFTLEDVQALLDSLEEGISSLPSLSLDEINENLDKINDAIEEIKTTIFTGRTIEENGVEIKIPSLISSRDTWQNSFEEAGEKEAASQGEITRLEREIISLEQEKLNPPLIIIGYYSDYEQPIYGYKNYDVEINTRKEEIAKTQNGYYTFTEITTNWIGDESGHYESITTYDYSNKPWMSKFGSREAWAQDYWIWQHYGVSEGNNVYGLYDGLYGKYTPGLLDWQARTAYAQEQRDNFQDGLDAAEEVLAGLQDRQSELQTAKEGKT